MTQTFLMISTEQTLEELRSILKETEHLPNRHMVVRGLPQNRPFKEWLGVMKGLVTDPKSRALSIDIDPVRFERYGITRVPAIVQESDKGTPFPDRTSGFNLKTRINSDPDQRLLLKERLRILGTKPSQSTERLTQRQATLPTTQADHLIHIDPTVIAPRTLKSRGGSVIAIEGTPVNPFLIVPLRETLLLFDAEDENQIEWVKRYQHSGPSLLIASLTQDHPESRLKQLATRLKQRVFLLNSQLVSHLQLESLPAMVTVDKGVLKIQYEVPGVAQ